MVMRKHQRYFPLFEEASGALLPYFITVANGPISSSQVRCCIHAVQAAFSERHCCDKYFQLRTTFTCTWPTCARTHNSEVKLFGRWSN